MGTNYHGWQKQPNAISVQEVIENTLKTILKHSVDIVASGRTDAGVHAHQQIVHLDLPIEFDDKLLYRLNKLLPYDISINEFQPVTPEAHARFDANSRAYKYYINRKKTPFKKDLCYQYDRPLDIDFMNELADMLIGYTNFQCFSKVKTDVNTFDCDIFFAKWKAEGDELIFEIEANRFLRGMVRAIVGTLLDAGRGKISKQQFHDIIASQNRCVASAAAPPQGLFLYQIQYPESIYLL